MIVFASAQVDTFGQRTQGNPCSIPALLSRTHPRGASILNAVFRAVNDSGRMRLLRENAAASYKEPKPKKKSRFHELRSLSGRSR